MSNKKLRDVYNADPAAKKFLEDHPEFNGRFLEQEEVNNPGFNITEGRYTLHDIKSDIKAYGDMMLEAVNLLPANHTYKELLEDYYNGMSFAKLQAKHKSKNRNALWQRLCRAKRSALKNMSVKRHIPIINGQEPAATRTFSYNGDERVIYLIMDETLGDFVWVKADGEVLPDDVQDILDNDKDYKSWDYVDLRL